MWPLSMWTKQSRFDWLAWSCWLTGVLCHWDEGNANSIKICLNVTELFGFSIGIKIEAIIDSQITKGKHKIYCYNDDNRPILPVQWEFCTIQRLTVKKKDIKSLTINRHEMVENVQPMWVRWHRIQFCCWKNLKLFVGPRVLWEVLDVSHPRCRCCREIIDLWCRTASNNSSILGTAA